jgi:hypothetical protein
MIMAWRNRILPNFGYSSSIMCAVLLNGYLVETWGLAFAYLCTCVISIKLFTIPHKLKSLGRIIGLEYHGFSVKEIVGFLIR